MKLDIKINILTNIIKKIKFEQKIQ